MDSTLLALIVTLGILALVGLFGLIEALGDRRKWRRREDAERTRTMGVIVGFAEERHRYAHRHGKVRSTHYSPSTIPSCAFRSTV